MSKADIVKQVMRSICTDVNGILELPNAFCERLTWCTDAMIDGVEYPAAKLIAQPGTRREKKIFYGERDGRRPPNRVFPDQGLIFQGTISGQLRTRLYLSNQWGYSGNPNDRDMQSWIDVIKTCGQTANRNYLTQQQENELMTPDNQQNPAPPPGGQFAVRHSEGNTNNPPNDQHAEADGDIMGHRNLIMFGAPGTGKSHKLNQMACSHKNAVGEDVAGYFENADCSECRYERVTFYPTYSYAQFVGTYKPVMKPKVNGAAGEEEIAYEFVPGPFLRVLVKALNDPEHEYCLVIEEINRANAAAVFGDVFQLLDRGSNGVSEYSIAASEDIKKYLQKELGGSQYAMEFLKVAKKKNTQGMETAEWESCSLRIPSKMYIWATMNSADQGVFPMDTAFKRRWAFEYIGIDDRVTDECRRWMTVVKGYNWNELRRFINGLLSAYDVNEDKLMGPYFVKADNGNSITKNLFDSKVLMYLWEDAARMIRKKLFDEKIKTYSQLVTEWNKGGIKVFGKAVEKNTLPDDVKNLYVELAKGEDEKK